MCFALDSWQIARILNLKKNMGIDEKIVCFNGMFMVAKKTRLETFISNLIRRFKKERKKK